MSWTRVCSKDLIDTLSNNLLYNYWSITLYHNTPIPKTINDRSKSDQYKHTITIRRFIDTDSIFYEISETIKNASINNLLLPYIFDNTIINDISNNCIILLKSHLHKKLPNIYNVTTNIISDDLKQFLTSLYDMNVDLSNIEYGYQVVKIR